MLFTRLGLGESWTKESIQVLWHESFHVFSDLGGGKSFEEELQIDPGFDFVGLGSFHQRKEHGAGVSPLGYAGKEPTLSAQGQGRMAFSAALLSGVSNPQST